MNLVACFRSSSRLSCPPFRGPSGSVIEPLEARIAPAFGAVFELSSLNGSNGFKLSGEIVEDYAGAAISDAGDFNGDGFADLLIGAQSADPSGFASGAAYVVFGRHGGFAANLNLSSLDGTNGFQINGAVLGDRVGFAVGAAGDVNGDGFADLIIGAPEADPNGDVSGASYVVFGTASGIGASLNLSSLDGVNGFKINGVAAGDYSGGSVSGAGDINGDGFGDVIIGASGADPNGSYSGASYVVFGKASGFAANLELSALDGTNGFRLNGVSGYAGGDRSGRSVSGAGDVNGDGFADLIIGAPSPFSGSRGAAYVLFGKSNGFSANLNLASLDGINGFAITGVTPYDGAGGTVSGAGDVNGDGFADLLIGAYRADVSGAESGAAYVVFGNSGDFPASLSLANLNGANGFRLSGVATGDEAGRALGAAGDVNGDGFADLLVGAYKADANGADSGATYVVFGQPSGFGTNLNLSSLDGTNGLKINGVAAGDLSGGSAKGVGDFNGDGLADLLIGARGADPNAGGSGAAYVIFVARAPEIHVWDGSESNDWFTAANWTPDGVPGVIDTAILSSNATITLTSAASVASFVQSDGILTGPGGLTVSSFTWSGGTQSGPGSTTVPVGGSLLIDGASLKMLSQRSLENFGLGLWQDAGSVQLSQGAIFSNHGSFEIQNDASLEAVPGAGQPMLVNTGTLQKTTGTGTTNFIGLSVENGGTFRIGSGAIFLSGTSASFTQTDGSTELSGGSFSATGATTVMFAGGLLNGSGTIAASVVNTGAIVQPGGPGSAGTLSIEGNYTQGAQATLVIELGSTANDQLVVGGVATLGGILEVNAIGGFTIPGGSSFSVISYASFNGSFAGLDAPSGVTADPGVSALILNAQAASGQRSMTVTDADGDQVTLKVNKGSIPNDALTLGPNGELQRIDLRAAGNSLDGATFTVDVRQAGGGDGAVNVGAIDASGMNLAKVRIAGDLGQIDIGTGDPRKPALKSLTVGSLGAMGATTQPDGTENPLFTQVTGALGKLTVQRDVMNAIVEVSSKLGKVVIGGSLMDTETSALRALGLNLPGVFQNGGIPPVGSGPGTIFAPEIRSVTVMGDVDGGEIAAETSIKTVKIRRNLISDDPEEQAILRVGAGVSKVLIQGDVRNALILAGYNKDLEAKNPDASIGKVVVKGDWTASSVVAGVTDPSHDGFGVGDAVITGDATPNLLSRIASVIIKGTATGSATPTFNSAVTAQKIGTLRIDGEKVPLTQGPDDLQLDPLNQNFRAVEI